MHAGEEDHARPGWTTSRRGQDSLWKSQSEWQMTEINGESDSMVWPTFGSRTAKEQHFIDLCLTSKCCPIWHHCWDYVCTILVNWLRFVDRFIKDYITFMFNVILAVQVRRRFCSTHCRERSLLQLENHIVFAFHSKAVQLLQPAGSMYVSTCPSTASVRHLA